MRRTILAALAAALTLTLGTAIAPHGDAASASTSPAATEGEFVARINALRASRGLPALAVDPELTAAARSWAANMASQGRIFHTSNLAAGVSARWTKLGENVGVGGDVPSLFQAFVDSPTHYANLVDPSYSRVGVGVVVVGGRIFTAHRFMGVAAAPPPPPPTTAPPPTAPPPPPSTTPPPPPPTTAAPPTTSTTTSTTTPPEPSKFGNLERIRELIEAG